MTEGMEQMLNFWLPVIGTSNFINMMCLIFITLKGD